MRSFIGILLSFLIVINSNVSGSRLDDRALTIADIPPCGLTCLLLTVPAAGCGIADLECQCTSQVLAYSTSACILANCTMADSLGTSKVQAELCNLSNESKSSRLFASLTVVFTVVCVCVLLRIASKLLTQRMRIDDVIILITLLLSTVLYGSAYAMVQHGFGKHLWSLQPGQLQAALKYFYVCWNLYVITLGLVKVSLLAFYLQIFPGRKFRIVCYAILGYVTISTLIIQFLTIFACTPVQSFWNRDIKGVCLDVTAIGFANSANAILQDLIILFLPMPSVLKLRMRRWRKIAVVLMFAVGAFGCITTIIRLRVLLDFKISIDPTWDYTEVTMWTGAELASGIACASLPAIRQLLNITVPKRFQTFFTNRSQSRSTPMPVQGSMKGAQRQRKGYSVFPLPSFSEHDLSSYGTKTEISSSTWTKSRSPASQDIEHGNTHYEETEKSSWLPLRTLFKNKPRSLQTSFWSSVDRSGSPPLSPRPAQTLANTDFRGASSRAKVVGSTWKETSDEQVELLQVPEASYRSGGNRSDGITALPRVGILPDKEYSPSGRTPNLRDNR